MLLGIESLPILPYCLYQLASPSPSNSTRRHQGKNVDIHHHRPAAPTSSVARLACCALRHGALPGTLYCSGYCAGPPLLMRWRRAGRCDLTIVGGGTHSARGRGGWDIDDTGMCLVCRYVHVSLLCRLWSDCYVCSYPSVFALPNHRSGNVPHPNLHMLLTYIRYVVHGTPFQLNSLVLILISSRDFHRFCLDFHDRLGITEAHR